MTAMKIEPADVVSAPVGDSDALPAWAESLIALVSEAAKAGEVVEVHTHVPTLTPREVATRLGISTSTVTRRVKDGSIRALRVGNRHRIPLAEYDRFRAELMSSIASHYADDIEAELLD